MRSHSNSLTYLHYGATKRCLSISRPASCALAASGSLNYTCNANGTLTYDGLAVNGTSDDGQYGLQVYFASVSPPASGARARCMGLRARTFVLACSIRAMLYRLPHWRCHAAL